MTRFKTISILALLAVIATATIGVMFLLSEDLSQKHNSFTRRFIHRATLERDADLKFNTYFFAGEHNGNLYLGSTSVPLYVNLYDSLLQKQATNRISLERSDFAFRSINLIVQPPDFYFTDGTVPCIFSGKIKDWKAGLKYNGSTWFNNPQVMDSSTIAFRTRDAQGYSAIGIMPQLGGKAVIGEGILQKQVDGVFDADGTLLYDMPTDKLVYLYRYRNQYIVMDNTGKVEKRATTIDTISKAQIEVTQITDRNQQKMSKPPLVVNKGNAIYKNLLFVNAALVGRNEAKEMWGMASIIDVYDMSEESYITSFYVYDIGGKKIRSFIVRNNKLYALIGTHLVSYTLDAGIVKNYKDTIH